MDSAYVSEYGYSFLQGYSGGITRYDDDIDFSPKEIAEELSSRILNNVPMTLRPPAEQI